MKRPEPIDYETDQEYYDAMATYHEHLNHLEWIRNGAKRSLINLAVGLAVVVGVIYGVVKIISYF